MKVAMTDNIASATPDSDDYNTGGKIRVNGVTVTIPKNLQVQFPAAWVPFKTVANGQFEGYEVSVSETDPTLEASYLTPPRSQAMLSMATPSPV
jgi:hypothetical protein